MPNKKITDYRNHDEIHRQEISERVSLVKNSLLSSHYQNRWTVVGLKQIINRFFMLLQVRCVIMILEKTPDNNYRVLHHTCLDPYWKNDFEHYIKEHFAKNDDGQDFITIESQLCTQTHNGQETLIDECLIEFYKDKYFMIHQIDSPKDRDLSVQDDRKFPPLHIDETQFLSALAREFKISLRNERMENFFRNANIHQDVLNKQEQWHKKEIIQQTCSELDQGWQYIPNDFFEDHYQEIRVIFDREYRKIQISPLLSNGTNSPNIFFFVRIFSQKQYRFHDNRNNRNGTYAYSLRMLIPDAQKKDLRKAFKLLNRKRALKVKLKSFQGEGFDDDFFWDMLQKTNGIEEIFEILESPYGLEERSMSDSVFETGYVNIKESPIAFSGTNRLEEHALKKKGENAYKRLVCFHYMLLLFSSHKVEKSSDISTLLVPGHVGGSPFFCIGFVFSRKQEDEHSKWLDNYHFYHSVCHYLIRGARSKIRDLYLREISRIYLEDQEGIVSELVKYDTFSPPKVCDVLNPKFKNLSRIFPFKYIEFKEVPQNRRDNCTGEGFIHSYLREKRIYFVCVKENPFFIRYLDGQFLEQDQIERCLANADQQLKERVSKKVNDQKRENYAYNRK